METSFQGRTFVLPFTSQKDLGLVLMRLYQYDPLVFKHSENTATLALQFWELFLSRNEYREKLGLKEDHSSRSFKQRLYFNALFHDVGKMFIPKAILQKAGPLTEREREIMQQHADLGFEFIVQEVSPRRRGYFRAIKYHHTWWSELKNLTDFSFEEKFLISFISIADAIEAISAVRPYNPKVVPVREAISLMDEDRGRYNPDILDVLKDEVENVQQFIDMMHKDERSLLST